MKVKLFAVVISYYPNIEKLRENIDKYLSDVDFLMIWENTPFVDREKYRLNISIFKEKVIMAGEKDNMFIAYPLNRAVEYAKLHGFTHILTMDQDSCFEVGHFKKYKEIATARYNKNIWGPNPNNFFTPVQDIPQKRERLMTSGNIINLDLFDEIGMFREDYKIDCVDFEFCYRARRYGYQCYSVNSILIHQTFGRKIRTRFNFDTYQYPPIRLYFMARNNIMLHCEYPEYGFHDIVTYIIKPIPKIILTESGKVAKIFSILKGASVGLFIVLKYKLRHKRKKILYGRK